MTDQQPNSELRRLVARLACVRDRDREGVMSRLSGSSRVVVQSLLDDLLHASHGVSSNTFGEDHEVDAGKSRRKVDAVAMRNLLVRARPAMRARLLGSLTLSSEKVDNPDATMYREMAAYFVHDGVPEGRMTSYTKDVIRSHLITQCLGASRPSPLNAPVACKLRMRGFPWTMKR